MNRCFPERCSLLLNIYTGITVGDQIWISISNDYDQLNSNVDDSLTPAGVTLSIAMNATTTMMRSPGRSLYIMLADMSAQDPSKLSPL